MRHVAFYYIMPTPLPEMQSETSDSPDPELERAQRENEELRRRVENLIFEARLISFDFSEETYAQSQSR